MSLFGASTNQPNVTFGTTANTQSSAGTLFGANANSTSFGSNTNSSAGTLFGASNTSINNSSAGTLFGTAASNPSSTGFGGFGQKSAATNTFGANSSTPVAGFGQTAPATSTSGFGFGTNQLTTSSNTSGFGTGATGNTGFGGFGSFNTTTSASGNQTAKPAFGGFGSLTNTQQTGFGTQNQQTSFGLQNQQQGKPQIQEKVWQELALIRAHFDPTSPLCHFRHYFYNMVPRNEVHLYVRPPNQDEHLWNEAVRKNPDPSCLVPVLAVGFDDILKRMEVQSKQSDLYQQKLKETEDRLASVQREYMLGTLVKLEEHKRRHIDITQRLLRLLRYSQILRYKNFPLNAEEEKTVEQLQKMARAKNCPEELYTKMVGLWNQIQAAKARMSETNGKTEIWRSVSEEDTNRIAKVLEDKQQGILHIASTLKSDTKELEEIVEAIKKR
ncbi:hypothetical protein G6F43_007889 [Rhizopus delemar]|nr:hypothetical protein G6F43_007889 [Rhizopus delemar]